MKYGCKAIKPQMDESADEINSMEERFRETTNQDFPLVDSSVKLMKNIQKEAIEYIPCLFIPYEEGGNKIVIYFHGNAEDIGLAFDLLYMFGERM